MKIIKRDGREVEFERDKIVNAMLKAYKEIYPDDPQGLASAEYQFKSIAERIKNNALNKGITLTVEDVQDSVEDSLMDLEYNRVAKAYILYRNERTRQRNAMWEMTDLQRDIYEQKYRWKGEDFQSFLDRVSGGNPVRASLF